MKYFYNVKTNFNYNYIDFYEWNKDDLIINIKKIPILKVNKKIYKKLLTNIVQFDKLRYFQLFKEHKNLLITNGYDVFVMRINKHFISSHRSSILINDELDIAYMAKKIKVTKISFKIIKILKQKLYVRNEKEKKIYIIKQLKQSIKNDDKKIIYLNYELLNSYIQDKQLALNNLLNSTDNPIIIQYLYNFFINDPIIN